MNDVQLMEKLNTLIEMWAEVACICSLDPSTRADGAIRRDCISDLQEILDGDYSCIEPIEDKDGE